jgi:hypothetical protein
MYLYLIICYVRIYIYMYIYIICVCIQGTLIAACDLITSVGATVRRRQSP